MEEKASSEVVLLGSWSGSATTRVALALKLKGIPYKYVEEDYLTNKSDLLLKYNPVHKKVPVLVHNGRPIAESLVILEYIDENSNHSPRLLPEDPYQRAKVRFWVNFYDQKIRPGSYSMFQSKGKEREKAIEDFKELIRVFEEGIEKDFPENFRFCNGEMILGLLDIVVAANASNYKAAQEVIGSEVIGSESEKSSEFFKWVNALKENPLIKEILPSHDKLVQKIKNKFVQSPQV